MSEGLENLRETITKFTPQGPATHRSEQEKRNIFTMLLLAWTGQRAYLLRALRQRLHGHFSSSTQLSTPHGYRNKSRTIEIGDTVNLFPQATILFVFPAYITTSHSLLIPRTHSKDRACTPSRAALAYHPPTLDAIHQGLPTNTVTKLTERTASVILVLFIIVEASITSLGTAIALSHLQRT